MEKKHPSCFKAYDIRGKVPEELNGDLAYKIGREYAAKFKVHKVIVGRDIRLSGKEIVKRLTDGLLDSGCDVVNLGICGTEEMYHAVFSGEEKGIDGGIIVTASHNPADYNGMKLVVQGARPVSGDSGLDEIGENVSSGKIPAAVLPRGKETDESNRKEYIEHLLSYINVNELTPLKIVVNSGNGCAGAVIDALQHTLPFSFIKMHHRADGSFPNGVPNPLLLENREETAEMVVEQGADLAIAWDGDFDRCFFWDEKGVFIEGYYIVGLLATALLQQHPGEKILHDPRLLWNTVELVEKGGGIPIVTKTGHAFIKERMRAENGLYGGEMSAHHYFRDFGYCDSGMVPWLLTTSLMCRLNKPLSAMVEDMMAAYPVSGEINSVVKDPDRVIKDLEKQYFEGERDYTDGLSVTFPDFRFNVRKSNTEPLLRLNVESRGDKELLQRKTDELLQSINR